MPVRTLDRLRRDQQDLLEQLQASGGPEGLAPGAASSPRPALRLGLIVQVVTSDATYGPHLVVQPQVFSGRPPEPSDGPEPTRRAYPSPNRLVGDYTVDEWVRLEVARGAEFALKLG